MFPEVSNVLELLSCLSTIAIYKCQLCSRASRRVCEFSRIQDGANLLVIVDSRLIDELNVRLCENSYDIHNQPIFMWLNPNRNLANLCARLTTHIHGQKRLPPSLIMEDNSQGRGSKTMARLPGVQCLSCLSELVVVGSSLEQ